MTGAVRSARAELAARLALLAVPRLKHDTLIALIEDHGSARAVCDALPRLVPADIAAGARSDAVRERTRRSLHAVETQGIRVVPFDDPAYPQLLTDRLGRIRPPVLFAIGDMGLLELTAVAVVGSRAATEYGLDMAERIADGVARAGGCVLSGVALGIDAAAHTAALDAEGATIGVLGCGVDVFYPRRNMALQARIARHGLLLSEQLPGEPPRKHLFPWRNRIIAALSGVIVVVEAGETSGAISTANHGGDCGVDVCAVPNPVDRPTAQGILRLYADGVRPFLGVRELLEDAGLQGDAEAGAGGRDVEHAPAGDVPARVWSQLGATPRHVDLVAAAAGLPVTDVLVTLLELELDGYAVQLGGGRFARRKRPAPRNREPVAGYQSV
jgi:DNA processing protein